eukprot:TRINITY_DN1486_c0_g1_i1.p1 TRINITY_DN1486_c0_g1~~TRINITY_DN1486_c0_g1_i1.p1  ORF type:complete len:617 (+),score=129.97 TRINITY_DN1486_c0_g1_i1:125-1852(+)
MIEQDFFGRQPTSPIGDVLSPVSEDNNYWDDNNNSNQGTLTRDSFFNPLLVNTLPVVNLDFLNDYTYTNTTNKNSIKAPVLIDLTDDQNLIQTKINPNEKKRRFNQRNDNTNTHPNQIFNPLLIDNYLLQSAHVTSYLYRFKSHLLSTHTITPTPLSLDYLLPYLSPSPPPPTPHLLSLYISLGFGALSLSQISACRSFFLLALQTLQALPPTPSISLASSMFAIETWSWVFGLAPQMFDQFLTTKTGVHEKVQSVMVKGDAKSYVAVKMKIMSMMMGSDRKETKLREVLNVLEEGVDFDEGYEEQSRKDIVLLSFFMAHMTHILGILVTFKSQKQKFHNWTNTHEDNFKHHNEDNNNNNKNNYNNNNNNNNNMGNEEDNLIDSEYFYTLYVRIGNLEQINEQSRKEKYIHAENSSTHYSAASNSDESTPYWEVKMYLSVLKYLVSRNCPGRRERETGTQYIDSFLYDFENHWFNMIIVVGAMVVESLMEERDWARCARIMRRIKTMKDTGRVPCLALWVEKYGGVLRREREKEVSKDDGGELQFQEFIMAGGLNKGGNKRNTWRSYEPHVKRTK